MLLKLITFAAISVAVFLAIALGLIASQPSVDRTGEASLDFSRQGERGDGGASADLETWTARDGAELGVRRYPAGRDDVPLVVIVHGSGWHGQAYEPLARALAGAADIVLPDLRGHGPHPARRGDIDYIGQLEDDLADLIALERKDGQKVVMLGHSSGGGLTIRFAGGAHGGLLSGAVLLAPFLKYNAPTMRPNSGGWAHALTRRIIGLTMLNAVGINWLNSLPVIDFAFSRDVIEGPLGATATKAYSFRLNTSYAPRSDYLKDVAALPPFLLVAGSDDEAFQADRFEPALDAANPGGRYIILDGVSHLDVPYASGTIEAVKGYLAEVTGRVN